MFAGVDVWAVFLVQRSGFLRTRNRRVGASNREVDPLGAGLYVFSKRRWRCPDNPHERTMLQSGLVLLAETYRPFTAGADIAALLPALSRIVHLWIPRVPHLDWPISAPSQRDKEGGCPIRTVGFGRLASPQRYSSVSRQVDPCESLSPDVTDTLSICALDSAGGRSAIEGEEWDGVRATSCGSSLLTKEPLTQIASTSLAGARWVEDAHVGPVLTVGVIVEEEVHEIWSDMFELVAAGGIDS